MADAPTPMLPRPSLAENVKPARKAGKLRTWRPSLVQQTEVTAEEFDRLGQVQNVDELAIWMEDTNLGEREKTSKARAYELVGLKFEQFLRKPVLMDVVKEADARNPNDIRNNARLQVEPGRLEQHGIDTKDLSTGIKPSVRKTRKRKRDVEDASRVVRQKNETTEKKGKKKFRLKLPKATLRQEANLVLWGKAIAFRWKT